jgi:hypothetical protein
MVPRITLHFPLISRHSITFYGVYVKDVIYGTKLRELRDFWTRILETVGALIPNMLQQTRAELCSRYPTCHQRCSRRRVLIFLIKLFVLCD